MEMDTTCFERKSSSSAANGMHSLLYFNLRDLSSCSTCVETRLGSAEDVEACSTSSLISTLSSLLAGKFGSCICGDNYFARSAAGAPMTAFVLADTVRTVLTGRELQRAKEARHSPWIGLVSITTASADLFYIVLRSMATLCTPEPCHLQMCGKGLYLYCHPTHTSPRTLHVIYATFVAPNAALCA